MLRIMGSRRASFSICSTWAQLWLTGLVAPQHVGSSWTRARTYVPCIGRQILNHCATREVPCPSLFVPLLKAFQGFPGGAVVGNLPANAGDTGSSPGLGRSHVPRSNWAREPQLLGLRVWSLCSATREAVMVRGPRTAMKSGPCLLQLGRALAQKRRPNTAKNK